MTILNRVKIKLHIPIDDVSNDAIIELLIDELTIKVLDYCYLKEIPNALEIFISDKVVENIRSGGTPIRGEWDDLQVKSISRGDTSTSFEVKSELLCSDDLQTLNKYKRTRVR